MKCTAETIHARASHRVEQTLVNNFHVSRVSNCDCSELATLKTTSLFQWQPAKCHKPRLEATCIMQFFLSWWKHMLWPPPCALWRILVQVPVDAKLIDVPATVLHICILLQFASADFFGFCQQLQCAACPPFVETLSGWCLTVQTPQAAGNAKQPSFVKTFFASTWSSHSAIWCFGSDLHELGVHDMASNPFQQNCSQSQKRFQLLLIYTFPSTIYIFLLSYLL